ncbi:MAG: MTAP family purine nucleoside phosphorylase [Deltaproteobacteria bacterium]|nr:MTAP family purine nucleoside phosphorylase [Deltaproteobacteria bacterium]
MTITPHLPYYKVMLGIIVGGNFSPEGMEVMERKGMETPFGEPSDNFTIGHLKGTEVTLLPRHGPQRIPPHRINHRANIYALKRLGVSEVIGINSVGSLREEIPPGWVVIPHDYLSPWSVVTFYEHQAMHITPALDERLRELIIRAATKAGINFVKEGVYIQTIGPRLETKAEIVMLCNFGDVVGMTMPHEATLCQEVGLAYASICSVDNYCHGIGERPLTEEEISQRARENAAKINNILLRMMEEMG